MSKKFKQEALTVDLDDLPDDMPEALKQMLAKAMGRETKYGPKKPLRSDVAQALQAYLIETEALKQEGIVLARKLDKLKNVIEAKRTLLWAKINDAHPETDSRPAKYNPDDHTYQVEASGDDEVTSGFVMGPSTDGDGKPVLN